MITNFNFTSYLPEQFKEHPDHPGIWVGNQGTILTTRKRRGNQYSHTGCDPYGSDPHPVKFQNCHGYLHNGTFGKAHRLVAQVWIPNPDNLPQVNHKDENKLNNCIDNLEWCTCEYNHNYGSYKAKMSAVKKGKPRPDMIGNQSGKANKGKKKFIGTDGKKHFYFPDEAKSLGLI